MSVHTSLQDPAFNSFGYILRSEMLGSYGAPVFNFLRNYHSVFRSDCTIPYSHQQCTRVSIFLHPLQHLLFSVLLFFFFLMVASPKRYEVERWLLLYRVMESVCTILNP